MSGEMRGRFPNGVLFAGVEVSDFFSEIIAKSGVKTKDKTRF